MSNCINRRKLVPERVDRGGTLRYAWLRAPPLRHAIKIKPKPQLGCLTQETPYEGGVAIGPETPPRKLPSFATKSMRWQTLGVVSKLRAILHSPCSFSLNIGHSVCLGKREACRRCSLYVLIEALPNPPSQMGRHGRSDRHHGEIQPGKRRPHRCWFSLWRYPPSRGPFVRPPRT